MTDLREHLRAALADEPASTIDPYSAIDAGRHHRAIRHRWLAGGTAAAIVGAFGVGTAVLGLNFDSGIETAPGVATPASPASFDPSTIDCLSYSSETVAHLREDFGPISAAYVCDAGERKIDGKAHPVFVLNQLQPDANGSLASLQSILEKPDAPAGDACRLWLDTGRRVWVVGASGLVLTRLPFDECSHTEAEAADALTRMVRTELSVQAIGPAAHPSKTPTKSEDSAKALEEAKRLAEEHPRSG